MRLINIEGGGKNRGTTHHVFKRGGRTRHRNIYMRSRGQAWASRVCTLGCTYAGVYVRWGVRTLLDQSERDILMSAQLIEKRD